MLGDRYIVERGDSLWKIAAKTMGGGKQWPRIWRYSNRPAVVRVTGRSIPNPDLIHVGQLLLIPRLPTERMTSGDPNDASSMSDLDTAAPATRVAEPATDGFVPKSPNTVASPNKPKLTDRPTPSIAAVVQVSARSALACGDVGTAILEGG